MLVIGDKLVDLDILNESFVCNLDACKGACCWEGDFGATLAPGEEEVLNQIKEDIRPYLSREGREHMDEHGVAHYYEEPKFLGTPILENGACIYLTYGDDGMALCGIEQAHKTGATSFKKPISCHLYPIRIRDNFANGFQKLEYYRWDICNPACEKGAKEKVKVYQFLEEALTRRFGRDFYLALEDAARHLESPE